ncbi:MAG: proton-conducting transporter membrane subunit, partial [Myxococcota bacterium]
ERRRTRELREFGGLAAAMPRFAFGLLVLTFSVIGIPGLSGFVGDFLVIEGAYSSTGMTVETTTGEFAKFAWALGGVLGVGAVISVTLALGRTHPQRQIDAPTRVIATLVVIAISSLLLFPPVKYFEGGLLLRPLNPYVLNLEPFGELFAVLAVVSTLGLLTTAVYGARLLRGTLFGPIQRVENRRVNDLNTREWCALLPVLGACVALGLYPQSLVRILEPTVKKYVADFRHAAELPPEGANSNANPTENR